MKEQRGWIPRLREGLRGRSTRSREASPSQSAGDDQAGNTKVETGEPAKRHDLSLSVGSQDASTFFARVPLEIRQMIYLQVWKAGLPLLRLHIHAADRDGGPLQHTVCIVGQDEKPALDKTFDNPWPQWPRVIVPPRIWWSWCLRLRWGRHWKCQERVMLGWDPNDVGMPRTAGKTGLLDSALSCKKMYAEVMLSFFNSVTLIFTSSEDAYRFLVRESHPWLHEVRRLELSFSHLDHIYLNTSVDCPQEGPSRALPYGMGMWRTLLEGIQPPKTSLKDLKVTFFGRPKAQSADHVRMLESDDWKLDGKVEVLFEALGTQYIRFGEEDMRQEPL